MKKLELIMTTCWIIQVNKNILSFLFFTKKFCLVCTESFTLGYKAIWSDISVNMNYNVECNFFKRDLFAIFFTLMSKAILSDIAVNMNYNVECNF